VSAITIVIPTLGRPQLLARVLARLDAQTTGDFEVVVVADAKETRTAELDALMNDRAYDIRRLQAARPGASAARNVGWRAAAAPIVLFIDDDVLPEPPLVAEHLAWHERHPETEVGVLGHVRWADELEVTPFMRWLEYGIQFDYPNIDGTEAGWGRFYTANGSVKRVLLDGVGGLEEEALPYGYEDLDLALRMHERFGFRLLYNRAAVAEHLHPMDLEFWKRRVARIAVSERQFVTMHPDVPPYFHDLFAAAAAAPPAKGRAARLARFVPRSTPVIGPRVWGSADAVFRQALAPSFFEGWRAAGEGRGQELVSAADGLNPSGS
jgi:glycosyltransferase involved in cell wall biosynthesis